MRILTDQDVWKETVALLRLWGHDVVTARELGLARASDRELLARAEKDKRILITRDSHFGSLVFLGGSRSSGVIFLRVSPDTRGRVHSELATLLRKHKEEDLWSCFCTVEPGRHRIRRTPLRESGER